MKFLPMFLYSMLVCVCVSAVMSDSDVPLPYLLEGACCLAFVSFNELILLLLPRTFPEHCVVIFITILDCFLSRKVSSSCAHRLDGNQSVMRHLCLLTMADAIYLQVDRRKEGKD